jgi:proteasome lid subunit RPN8/RPN11
MNERLWTLLGSRDAGTGTWRITRHHMVIGRPAEVEADWAWILDRDEAHSDVMGFYHTHPDGCGLAPSQRDIRTMRAWCSALGKPLLCLIAENRKPGVPAGYVFLNDEHGGEPVGSLARETERLFVVEES